jgi:uncharacterized protein YraI
MWRKLALLMLFALSTLVVQTAQPVSAQSNTAWQGAYYDNAYLVGTPVLTRQDGQIAFDWGTGSPAAGIPADDFSVRWSADVAFNPGIYRFYIQADDSVRLWVGFQRVLDTMDNPRPGQLLTVDVSLAGGTQHVQLDYREQWGNAHIYLDWADLATHPAGPRFYTPQPISYPAFTPGVWVAEYYSNPTLSGAPAAILSQNSPPAHYWASGAPLGSLPADYFSIRWISSQYLAAGTYRFSALADDGVRVIVDGVRVIDEFHSASGITYTGDIALAAGLHTIGVEYYEAEGLAFITLSFGQIVPAAPPTAATAQVLASALNVRESPTCDCQVLIRVYAGQTYPVMGRNRDASWWQINVQGMIGWVFARFVSITNAGAVPITDDSAVPHYPPTGFTVTARYTSAIRAHAGSREAYLGRLPTGASAVLLGRNAAATWWHIEYEGVPGWVIAAALRLPPGVDVRLLPIH